MSDAMYELKQEGVIDESVFAFISVTDDDDEERLEITSAKRWIPNHPYESMYGNRRGAMNIEKLRTALHSFGFEEAAEQIAMLLRIQSSATYKKHRSAYF